MTRSRQTAARSTKPSTPSDQLDLGDAQTTKSKPRRTAVEIKIGIQHTPREITLDVDLTADQVAKELADATAKSATLIFKDVKGRRVLLPSEKIAYIEIGEPEQRRVGFNTD